MTPTRRLHNEYRRLCPQQQPACSDSAGAPGSHRPAASAKRADCGGYAERLRQPGGYLDLAGFDVSATQPVIARIHQAVTAARAAGMQIIWFQNGWDNQYVEAGDAGSPNFHKSNALKTMRQRPELHGTLLAKVAGIMRWWMSWYLKPAILCCPNRATAAFSTRRSTACAQRYSSSGVYRHCHQRLRGIDAARRFFLEYFGVVLADATHRRTVVCSAGGAVPLKPFWLGQRYRHLLRGAEVVTAVSPALNKDSESCLKQ